MKQFNGEINGKRIPDFTKLDYTNIQNLKDRIEVVKELVEEDGFTNDFFSTYFDNYYIVSPNQEGYLAEEDVVCKVLEILGTYIIQSKDVESHRKIKYRFWKDIGDFNKSMESKNISISSLQNEKEDNSVDIIDMFVDRKNDINQKIVRNISINKKDIEDIVEIKELNKAIEYLKTENAIDEIRKKSISVSEKVDNKNVASRLGYISNNTKQYVGNYIKNLKENQIEIKKCIKRPIEFKSLLKDEGVPNKLDIIDFMEEKDVYELLPYLSMKEDLTTDLGIIVYDLKQLIKKTKFSKRESEVLKLIIKGVNPNENTFIADKIGIKKQNVNTYIERICSKITKTYEKQVELYREIVRRKNIV